MTIHNYDIYHPFYTPQEAQSIIEGAERAMPGMGELMAKGLGNSCRLRRMDAMDESGECYCDGKYLCRKHSDESAKSGG